MWELAAENECGDVESVWELDTNRSGAKRKGKEKKAGMQIF